MARAGVAGGLQSVLSALDLLDCFTDAPELGVTELARRMDLSKSTTHRLLTTLCARGVVERNPSNGRYRLGIRLYALGQLAVSRNRIRERALPLLHELRRQSGSTVHLAVPDGAEVIYLERLIGPGATRDLVRIATRLPAHCTSSGKALAAFEPQLAAARCSAGFATLTEQSIDSSQEYERALSVIRTQRYATNLDEAAVGYASVAAPVLAPDGRARVAISLVGPTEKIRREIARTALLVQTAAVRLARELAPIYLTS